MSIYDPTEFGSTEASTSEPAKKKRRGTVRLLVYGSLIGLLWGFWIYQPWEFDFIPRTPPFPNPPVDPTSDGLFRAGTKVLVVTAHPDDSEFYIGGTLCKLRDSGAVIHQVIVTEGDKAYYGPFTNVAQNRKVRHKEAISAAKTWHGQDLLFLGYPDGRLRATRELVARLETAIAQFQPDYVLGFDYDYPPRLSHGDHRQAGKAVALALQNAPNVKWYMRFSTSAPNYVSDITDYWDQKADLLKIHKSQFYGDRLEQVTNMVEHLATEDGKRVSVDYGEGFRCMRIAKGQ